MIDIDKINYTTGSNRLSLKNQDKTNVVSEKKNTERKKRKKKSAINSEDDGLPHIDEFV